MTKILRTLRLRRPLEAWGIPLLAVTMATSCLAEDPASGPSGSHAGVEISRVRATGQATVSAPPDLAIVELGVSSEAREAGDAAKANAERTTRVLAALRESFADAAEIETTGYRLQPRYTFEKGGGRTLEGFTAWNGVRVSSRAVESAGRIIDVAVAAGAGEVGGIRFGLADDGPKSAEALALATRQARQRADVIAEALGLRVIRVLGVEEGAPAGLPGPMRSRSLAMAAESAPTPTQPGEIEVHADVAIEVEIGP